MNALRVSLLAAAATGIVQAGPAERAILAAMRLAEQPNYTWSATVVDDARTYDIEGKTDATGCTWVRLPMVKTISRRLGREAESDIQAFFVPGAVPVLHTARGWQRLDELPRRAHDDREEVDPWVASFPGTRGGLLGGSTTGSPLGTDPFGFPPAPVFRSPPDEDARPYSNAQFAASLPHDELAIIVSSYAELRVDGDVASGTLTEMGAQLLLVREGTADVAPLAAAGAFKLLIKGGVVVKYAVRLEGILQLERKRKVHVHQLASTTLKSIGATRVEMPDDARRKLW